MIDHNTNILVTGASGFIGQNLLNSKEFSEYKLHPLSLRDIDFRLLDLSNIDVIIHLAGISSNNANSDDIFEVNQNLAIDFARNAKTKNVKHFIFVSTTKVFGDNHIKTEFSINDDCNPTDDYSKSKFNAENGILKLETYSFSVTIIRPALIYGSGVKGNLKSVMDLIRKGLPLPFAEINNLRSMVFVGNLINFIEFIIRKNLSGHHIVTDNHNISTSELFGVLSSYLNTNQYLFRLPLFFRMMLKKIKPGIYNRLFSSLIYRVDDQYRQIGFSPPYSVHEGLKVMADSYKSKVI